MKNNDKTIIFCEGEHDSLFLKKMFDVLNIKNYRIFDQNTSDKLKQLKDAETIEIKRFTDFNFYNTYYSYKILVKSEAGKDKAIPLFSRNLPMCFQSNLQLILMLDLDDAPVNLGIEKIIKKITTTRTAVRIEPNLIRKNDMIYLYENAVKTKESQKTDGKFYSVLFASSLEKESGKIKSFDDSDIEGKISKLVELHDIQNTFSLLF
ncbi:hypothetical protein MSIBF_A3330007 [groundwater metagenome]|uniref:Uncharacterized protein n=1 Tax=groundwater metagenome TaxID=717931 RepID=A0A098ECB2_9ZZZZ